jgi:hypothetical protein
VWNTSAGNDGGWMQTMVLVVFTASTLLSGWAAHRTCMTDPCDDALVTAQIQHPLEKIPASAEEQIFCYICECSVHHSSKHCRYCDKCVVKFDHHCKWLNTCVGQKNYRTFLMLVAAVAVMLSVQEGLSVALLVYSYSHADLMRSVLADQPLLGSLTLGGVRGVLIGGAVAYTAMLAMVLQLLSFHALLRKSVCRCVSPKCVCSVSLISALVCLLPSPHVVYKGQTTYEFIISEQKRLRDKKNKKIITTTAKQLSKKTDAGASLSVSAAGPETPPPSDALSAETVRVPKENMYNSPEPDGGDISMGAVSSTSDVHLGVNELNGSSHAIQPSDQELARAARFDKIVQSNSGDLVL